MHTVAQTWPNGPISLFQSFQHFSCDPNVFEWQTAVDEGNDPERIPAALQWHNPTLDLFYTQEFYQFIAKAYDKPRYTLHYRTDAPVNIRSIFYFPESIPQLHNLQHMEVGVSLYSRKVLIQSKAHKVLPSWLRFVRGIVDSEDIPLNLSRELLQDGALIAKLNAVLTSRIVKFLQDQLRKDRVKFENFFQGCGIFIREGVVTTENAEQKQDIAKLLLFESSCEKPGALISLPLYVERMKPTQKRIYYLCAPR